MDSNQGNTLHSGESSIHPHRLPLATFLIQPKILFLWSCTSLLTWGLLLIPLESIFLVVASLLYLLYAIFFFSYGFDVIENTALGYADAPAFSNALSGSRIRLVRQVFVFALGLTLIELTPVAFHWLTISMLLAVAPAVCSAIVFHESVPRALNPVRIWQFISNMGFGYMALRLLTTSVLLLCLVVASGELELAVTVGGKGLISTGAVMLVLMMFRGTGALLHLRREALGIKTEFSVEQDEYKAAEVIRGEAAEFLGKVKTEFKLKGTSSAYRMLELELKRHNYRDDAIYFDLLKEMADRRLLYRFAGSYVGRLIETEPSHAWAVLLEMHGEVGDEFRLSSGVDLLRLAKTAETRQERTVLLGLMENFERNFPLHPEVRRAWLTAAELALLINDKDRASALLARVDKISGTLDEARLERARLQLRH